MFATKWWDYRQLHPTQATLMFWSHYRVARRRAIDEYIDRAKARTNLYMPRENFLNFKSPALITGIWNARQHADELGMPYGYYCHFAIKALMRFAPKWKTKVPLPSVFNREKTREAVASAWRTLCEDRVVQAETDFFDLKNYRAHRDQDAYQGWLCKRIKGRPNLTSNLSILMETQLTPEIAAQHLGADVVASVVPT